MLSQQCCARVLSPPGAACCSQPIVDLGGPQAGSPEVGKCDSDPVTRYDLWPTGGIYEEVRSHCQSGVHIPRHVSSRALPRLVTCQAEHRTGELINALAAPHLREVSSVIVI